MLLKILNALLQCVDLFTQADKYDFLAERSASFEACVMDYSAGAVTSHFPFGNIFTACRADHSFPFLIDLNNSDTLENIRDVMLAFFCRFNSAHC